MLFQLVCVDRRYMRMNCFNIRELQGILKRRFFIDLINSNDHHKFLNNSIISLRFRLNNHQNIHNDIFLFYNFGTTLVPKTKVVTITNMYYENIYLSIVNFIKNFFINKLSMINLNFLKIDLYYLSITNSNIILLWFNFVQTILNATLYTYLSLYDFQGVIKNIFMVNFNLYTSTHLNQLLPKFYKNTDNKGNTITYTSNNLIINYRNNTLSMLELSNNFRFLRFNNPLINYDYKCGHYLGIWDQLYPSLTTSFIEVARGIRKAPWFYSDQFNELLSNLYKNFTLKFNTKLNLQLTEVEN